MRWMDFILLILLLSTLIYGINVLIDLVPKETLAYNPYEGNISLIPKSGAVQFYPNMRYPNNTITYSIESACSPSKIEDIKQALDLLSQNTSLRFFYEKDGQIKYLCSQLEPNPEQRGHFVAGEGGPDKIINTSIFAVILAGKVSLYRAEKCDTPNIAIHETLHALGFDHIQDSSDIMYPVTDCNKHLKKTTINAINKLYSYASEPDLGIDYVAANQTGNYLNFHITITNHGLAASRKSNLTLYSDSKSLKTFDLGALDIGTKKFLDVQNMNLGSDKINTVSFIVAPNDGQEDLFAKNDLAEINLIYAR